MAPAFIQMGKIYPKCEFGLAGMYILVKAGIMVKCMVKKRKW